MKITWKKLYTRMTEQNEGMYVNSVILYATRPYLIKTIEHEDEMDQGVFNIERYVAQYEKRLILDLWIVELRFYWRSKEIKKNENS
jgi:hypothetical protein